ncbi:MAG TPA: cytochrome c oxidase assembly protein [Vicinamibacterales bacterium]|jgi:putative membrane protein|nr:cytochrome c oxidase assembly protein [Vicinamibacterales bacterium]
MRVNTGGRAGWVGLVLITTSVCLSAHGGEVHSLNAPQAFSPWDVAVLIGLLIVGSLYLRGTILLARRGASGRRFEPIAFAIGWSALVLSILPPIDSLSIEYFSVHMIQHELMMLVGAPLLILGRPLQRCLTGMPDSLRMPTARILQAPSMSWTWRILTAPLVAWALHGLAIWVWHMPALYDAAVGNEAIHTLQHAMFVGTAALFWWGMLYGRYGRAGYGVAVFYVFLTVVHTGILGAMVTFAGTPLYPIYAAPAAAHGIDALVDQQRAGLLMWIPAGLVMTLLGLALFAAWLGESERKSIQNAKFKMQTPAVLLLALCLGLAACDRDRDKSNARVASELTGGDPEKGRHDIVKYGCDTCHNIPGVLTATATVGPPLMQVGLRSYLAGRIDNTPENMIKWIRQPRSVDPQTAMPETGVTESDGRDIAAYLYTLR